MKIAVMIGIAAFMLMNTFIVWCALRVNAVCERRKNKYTANNTDGKEVPDDASESL